MSDVQQWLLVDNQTDVVVNNVVWDGNPSTWQPPENVTPMPRDTTPAVIWVYDQPTDSFVLQTVMGQGCVGFTWNGAEVVTNEPQPVLPGPDGGLK